MPIESFKDAYSIMYESYNRDEVLIEGFSPKLSTRIKTGLKNLFDYLSGLWKKICEIIIPKVKRLFKIADKETKKNWEVGSKTVVDKDAKGGNLKKAESNYVTAMVGMKVNKSFKGYFDRLYGNIDQFNTGFTTDSTVDDIEELYDDFNDELSSDTTKITTEIKGGQTYTININDVNINMYSALIAQYPYLGTHIDKFKTSLTNWVNANEETITEEDINKVSNMVRKLWSRIEKLTGILIDAVNSDLTKIARRGKLD